MLRHPAPGATEPPQAADTTWDAADLPPGFRLVANSTRRMGNEQRAVTHLVFSDGLATVSVFVEAPAAPGAGCVGSVSEPVRPVKYEQPVHAVSAMIPAMAFRKLPTPYAPQTVGPGICQLV